MEQKDFFSELKEHLKNELPFVVYRKPEESTIKALLQNGAEENGNEDFTRPGFVFAPFDNHKRSFFLPLDQSKELQLQNYSSEDVSATGLKEGFEKDVEKGGRENHLLLVEKGIQQLKKEGLEKVVLSRREEVPLEEVNPLEIFKSLLQNYSTAFTYCWFHPSTGTWLGATPELLVKTEGLNFSTMALAGTQKFQKNMEVEWGAKEIQEQQYVTDSIIEDLNHTGDVEEIKASAAFTAKAGTLLHIRTDITGKLKTTENISKIIQALHPTPAVCGLPKSRAKEFILKEEAYDREFYTGFLGELNYQESKPRSRTRRNTENLAYASFRKKSAVYVNLRCMKLEDQNAVIFVGGGITRDSIAEDEYQETLNKAQTMKKVLVN